VFDELIRTSTVKSAVWPEAGLASGRKLTARSMKVLKNPGSLAPRKNDRLIFKRPLLAKYRFPVVH
jgi:hypothetical protein